MAEPQDMTGDKPSGPRGLALRAALALLVLGVSVASFIGLDLSRYLPGGNNSEVPTEEPAVDEEEPGSALAVPRDDELSYEEKIDQAEKALIAVLNNASEESIREGVVGPDKKLPAGENFLISSQDGSSDPSIAVVTLLADGGQDVRFTGEFADRYSDPNQRRRAAIDILGSGQFTIEFLGTTEPSIETDAERAVSAFNTVLWGASNDAIQNGIAEAGTPRPLGDTFSIQTDSGGEDVTVAFVTFLPGGGANTEFSQEFAALYPTPSGRRQAANALMISGQYKVVLATSQGLGSFNDVATGAMPGGQFEGPPIPPSLVDGGQQPLPG